MYDAHNAQRMCLMFNVHDDVLGDLLNSILIDVPATVKHVVNSETLPEDGLSKRKEEENRKPVENPTQIVWVSSI